MIGDFGGICPVPESYFAAEDAAREAREARYIEARDRLGCTGCTCKVVDDETGAMFCLQEEVFVKHGTATEYDCQYWEGEW